MLTFRELMNSGEGKPVLLGTWVHIGAPELIDIFGSCKFDFLILDAQHSAMSMRTIERMARACTANKLAALVRVAANLPHLISQALDYGAAGVVIPGISTANDAEAAVRAARFGPHGDRSACPMVRAAGQYTSDWRSYAGRCDTETGIVALVETPEGIANCEQIAEVPGVVALLAGPYDLAVAMGHGNNLRHPDVSNAMAELAKAGMRTGVPLIMPIFAPNADECREVMEEWQSRGVRVFTVGGDTLFLAHYTRGYVAELRASRRVETAALPKKTS
jgi:2-keto-3-deoxy-L-rhamnonate aldolase RhmA